MSLWELDTLAPHFVEERRQAAAAAHLLLEVRHTALQVQPAAQRRLAWQWFPGARPGEELLRDLLGRGAYPRRQQASPHPKAA